MHPLSRQLLSSSGSHPPPLFSDRFANMVPAMRLCLTLPLRAAGRRRTAAFTSTRTIHNNPPKPAKVVPVYGTGPPPEPPTPAAEYAVEERLARRKRQAEMLRQAKDIRKKNGNNSKPADLNAPVLKRRFWKDVSIKEVIGAYQIHLDSRPLRHPTTKSIIRIPLSKPQLAHALAVEWDQLLSAQEATKQHLIPLTSLVCRAVDIGAEDAAHPGGPGPIRESIVTGMMRYLDTDSLLCWAPPADSTDPHAPSSYLNDEGKSLRDLQEEAAGGVVGWLTSKVWPGVNIVPVLEDSGSILPRKQEPGVREVVQGWVFGLSCWELAGIERATLGGKSLLTAARLVCEWSEERQDLTQGEERKFGVEEAARVVSVEVEWQTRRWGEVEDTHDVEKEDLRRQLGSVILLVGGTGR
ncbi:ATP synthase mitochondrial F1 complex assembly factor 2 [Podospora pseudopauciseta]|uniref:ATP synthase mitochondrial F1 complex assembly factor 2 n=1 Tax=Podospora pseudopauciseta TaxID=2093780 RepID=A0ABR0I0L1_9PEZI|nr:ATP synthase mitochondrial F1 complex assembly factor 2 [Podospora pseudopauciseta]